MSLRDLRADVLEIADPRSPRIQLETFRDALVRFLVKMTAVPHPETLLGR
jgi:hypothetical protein